VPLAGFYYTYGNDADMIENRWIPDIKARYPEARWLRLDATIDDLDIGHLVSEYYSNAIFSPSTVIVVRNADHKPAQVHELAEALVGNPVADNALVLIGGGWNKTTKLGKLVKKSFVVKEFSKPEIKPFDLLDSLNTKSSSKVLQFSNLLFDAEYHPLAMFSLVFGHFLLLRKIKELEGNSAPVIAKRLGAHNFRIQKAMVACRYWTKDELAQALQDLGELDGQLRSWQYDERMLLQMALIKLCL